MKMIQTKTPAETIDIADLALSPINVSIDGKSIQVDARDRNLVDVADRTKIGIPAPCYRDEGQVGCCKGCVVEVDGNHKYACATAPRDGMDIVVNRPDLKALRKERIKEYAKNRENGEPCNCSSGDSSCCTPTEAGSCC